MTDRVKHWSPSEKIILPQVPHEGRPLALKTPDGIPAGFTQMDKYTRVYVSDKWLLVTGTPDESEDEETGHNCDAMGCGWEHVLYRFPLTTEATK